MGVLQPEPGGERTRVRAPERHPLPVGQPAALRHHTAEVRQVGERLATAQVAQVVRAEVAENQGWGGGLSERPRQIGGV